ncbi:two-component system sensor histidine kinase VanS [Allocatelliglobosispora scoriae]|uniref:histidine kinase n=1 Tax=Allocatelliglobosispora scoriae TaxID=643052 RepID=A0A841BUA0_9ACTN|nr:HAMP domain-containing sensor histidine kinase [Allocatelliglobosispora scoriae]MBB5870322.1 two-component system sensor histidine kinase VanS [Allocatelliglobosispora scoriae]
MTVRARLTLIYGALLALVSALLLTMVYLVVRYVPPYTISAVDMPDVGMGQAIAVTRSNFLDVLVWACIAGFIVVTGLGLLAVWVVAGRVLSPLDRITATASELGSGNLHERIALSGPDDELKRLADTFDSMLARLEHDFDAHQRFAANAAHELRTPLASSRTLLQVALANPAGYTVEGLSVQLLAANERSIQTTEALLALADATHAPLEPEVVDLTELVRSLLPAVGVTARLTPSCVDGDPALLRHLAGNLINNAVQHNIPGGRVTVTVADDTLTVANDGPLVTDVDRLFEPFYRASGRSHTGHGLGLAIVRAVVDAHHARLTATPNPTGGLTVAVRFTGQAERGEAR